jgi:hypothetical protein
MSENHWPVWMGAFRGLPPVGHILRDRAPKQWTRLYSLPNGERIPASENEMSEVLRRENLVASTVFGLGVPVTAWIVHYGETLPLVDMTHWSWSSDVPSWRSSESEREMLAGARFLQNTVRWTPGVFDDELRMRAMDQLAGLTIFSQFLGSAFCPYDGGMDVFMGSGARIASLLTLFPDWASSHPQGL